MKILIISDIHYGKDTNYPQLVSKDYISSFGSQFEKYLPKFQALITEHDLVIDLGDLISEENPDVDVALYKKIVSLFGNSKPVKFVLGNHEVRNVTKDPLLQVIGEEKAYYSFDIGGYHHIILDSFRNSRQEPCRIDSEQINWLKNDLEKTTFSSIVYCHYVLDDQSIENNYYFKNKPDRAFIQNKEEVRKIFEDSKKVVAVFSGHLHFYNQEKINNILYTTTPAFTENDGSGKPKADCLSVILNDNKADVSIINLN